MANKPSIPKGTRDYSPRTMIRRNHIFGNIRKVFESFGYQPIETPAMETLETLLGKYGEEGDKLIFRILNSGDFMQRSGYGDPKGFIQGSDDTSSLSREMANQISEKALRYDLTVPFARYVVQHRNEIILPFKRYQIQPVWRADRPQKGRYREFYQCDVDVIGSDSLLNEVELIQIVDQVFTNLNLKVSIRINNRKVLAGLADFIGESDKLIDLTVAIDKLDKIGLEGVKSELFEKGIGSAQVDNLLPLIVSAGSWKELIAKLKPVFAISPTGLKGLDEIETVFKILEQNHTRNEVVFDMSLARGLSYYTGAIFEVKSLETQMGSICGGGRYDDLTGIFGMPGMSGVGVSFGADRIYDVLEQLDRFPKSTHTLTQVLILNFGEEDVKFAIELAAKIREEGFRVEVYPDFAKVKKQMQYADVNRIPVVIMFGEDERNSKNVTIKEMTGGNQLMIPLDQVFKKIREWIA